MRTAHLALLCTMALVFACGGRFARTEGDDDTDGGRPSGQGGSDPSTAGRPTMAGTNTGAGTSLGGGVGQGGGITLGGKASAGGSTGGACGTCDPIACPPDSVPILSPDGCCSGCEPLSCPDIPCPSMDCGAGYHPERLPGACCPACVANSCAAQLESYASLRAILVEKYQSLGCVDDFSCFTFYDQNACDSSCGIPIPLQAFSDLQRNLNDFAQRTCSPNCPPVPQPCVPPSTPRCVGGRCV
jgi:hypothetical protein